MYCVSTSPLAPSEGIAEVSPMEILEGLRRIRSHTLRTTDNLVAGRIVGTGSGGGECGSGTTRYVRVGVENARHGKARCRGMVREASRGLLRNPGNPSFAYILFPSLLRPELGLRWHILDDLRFVRTILVITHSFPMTHIIPFGPFLFWTVSSHDPPGLRWLTFICQI